MFLDFCVEVRLTISQLLIGSLIIAVTTILHAAFIEGGITGLTRFGERLTAAPSYLAKTTMLVAATLWLLASHSVGVWLWAFMFNLLGAIDGLQGHKSKTVNVQAGWY